eukprot:COSAG04_NODE_139_length_23663_cov_6.466893_13_plen_113_part_00
MAQSQLVAFGPHGAASIALTAMDASADAGGAGGMVGIECATGGTAVCSRECSRGGRTPSPAPAPHAGARVATRTGADQSSETGGGGGSGTKVVMPEAESRMPLQVSSVSDGP